jgi:xanthine dehydrogenase accessory factor
VTSKAALFEEAARLAAEGRPFALATVVRVERPSSARVGDRALVTADGLLVGWVGGACTEPAVVREALGSLADGECRLTLLEGACVSEGVVEVLIEPQLPAPLLCVVGESPAAACLADLARRIGWRATDDLGASADAVVVAAMGRGDEAALEAALATSAGYVGLVASPRRAAAVLASLRSRGIDEEALARIRSPAGLDLGPSGQEEIAVAILAELVAWRGQVLQSNSSIARPDPVPVSAPTTSAEAVDPVCSMTVAPAKTKEMAVHEGVRYYFCCAGCRRRFEEEPARYLAEVRGS